MVRRLILLFIRRIVEAGVTRRIISYADTVRWHRPTEDDLCIIDSYSSLLATNHFSLLEVRLRRCGKRLESAFRMVTDQQIRRLYKLSNTEDTQAIAASKAGMDVKTARKYLRSRRLPSELKADRHWRTRQDEFAEVWPGIVEQIRTNPGWRRRRSLRRCNGRIRSGFPTASCARCNVGSSAGGQAKGRRRRCTSFRSIVPASCANRTLRT